MAEVHIGLVGVGWMGQAHAKACRAVPIYFGREPAVPVLEIVADATPELAEAGAKIVGCERWTADWREVVSDPRVDVVDITTPNVTHAEIAIAAAQAGKHVYCEKPVAMNVAEARDMVAAAEAAGVVTLVGFNYVKNPIQGLARRMIENGDMGDIILFRGWCDADFGVDPDLPSTWRMDREIAGTGVLGDMASHALSLSQMLVGDIAEVCGRMEIMIKERPVPILGSGAGHSAAAEIDSEKRAVTTDDIAQFLCTFDNGAPGVIEASRLATGRKNFVAYEIQGTKGALYFTQERANEIQIYRHTDAPAERGYKTVYAGPEHPNFGPFSPMAGMQIGTNDLKTIEVHDLVVAVATGQPAEPDLRFGLKVMEVIDAVARSAEERRWVRTDEV